MAAADQRKALNRVMDAWRRLTANAQSALRGEPILPPAANPPQRPQDGQQAPPQR